MTSFAREIVQIYEKRRDNALIKLDARRKEAFRLIPSLSDLDSEIGGLGIQLVRSVLHENFEESELLKIKLSKIRSQRLRLLEAAGLPQNWLEPHWECSLCEDTGYSGLPGGITASCSCSRQLVLDSMYNSSNLSKDAAIGFEMYTDEYYPDEASKQKYGVEGNVRAHMRTVHERMIKFSEHFLEKDCRSLYLYGPTGTGKTFMAKSAGKMLIEKGIGVLYLSAPALFDAARATKFRGDDYVEAEAAYKRILSVNLLILDDLGTEPASDSRYADFLTLLEERSRISNETRRTIIATNMDVKRLYSAYNERIGSRVAGDFDIIPFAGADIRLVKRYG